MPASKTIPIKLLYDTWFQDDIRTPAGTVLNADLDAAKALIADGKAERADPLPGDDQA